MKYKDTHEFYKASDALMDSQEKQREADMYVDTDKMYLITNQIREYIQTFKSQDTTGTNKVQREINHTSYLSKGEEQFLVNLGYKVTLIEAFRDASEYYVISW